MAKQLKKWSGEAIRELARARLKAHEDGAPAKALSEEVAPDFVFAAFNAEKAQRVLVVYDESEGDEQEILELCSTLGLSVVGEQAFRHRDQIESATYLGRGQLAKIREGLERLDGQALVLDLELSPAQVKNLENLFRVPVLDRHALILAIFKSHAQSSLAKLQVELAQLKFLQPRLSGLWQGLSRQRGSSGGLGGRGLGESRLELDRRVVKKRIAQLSARLEKAERVYETQSRRRSELSRVALVGYTNAGKSTLMRQLTRTDVLTENKLFSTLDTTIRPLQPPTRPRILVSDTVGFVKKLPHELIASFKSTLREACESQLLLHVVDASHVQWREHFFSTEIVLKEIGAGDIPRILLFNKIDKVGSLVRLRLFELKKMLVDFPQYEKVLLISAEKALGLDELRQSILTSFKAEELNYGNERGKERTARILAE